MSILHRSDIDNNDSTCAIETHSDAQRIKTPCHDQPTNEATDPEALMGIEITDARDLSASQKQDDPYLVCFDGAYDAEKYDKHVPQDNTGIQANCGFVVLAQKIGQP